MSSSHKSSTRTPVNTSHAIGEAPEEAYRGALDTKLASVRARLQLLCRRPPQLLHIEGRDADSRVSVALWLAAKLNCEASYASPCFSCDSCRRIAAVIASRSDDEDNAGAAASHPDIVFFDGRKSSIKIDDVRSLHRLLGEKPHFAKKRIIIFCEAQSLGIPAANSLLKILEEPSPDTIFVFTMPQRERILPTLISRGWVLTLPWHSPECCHGSEEWAWSEVLKTFLEEGKNWFGQSSLRTGADILNAQECLTAVQKGMLEKYSPSSASPLGQILSLCSDTDILIINELCMKYHDALLYQTNPVYVIDAFASQIYRIFNKLI